MKKICYFVVITMVIGGIVSCGKDSNSGSDNAADQYVGNWIGEDTSYSDYHPDYDRAANIRKLGNDEILILGFPNTGDTIKASVTENSIVQTYGSDDGYGSPLDYRFTVINTTKITFKEGHSIYTADGYLNKQ